MHIGDIGFAGEKLGFGLPQVSEAGVKQTASLLGRYFPELSVAISPKGKRGGRLGRGDTAQAATQMTMKLLPGAPTFNITQTASPTMTASPTVNVTVPSPPPIVKYPVTPPLTPGIPKAAPPSPTPTLPPTLPPTPAPSVPITSPAIPEKSPEPPQLVSDPYGWIKEQIATFQAKPIGGRASTYAGTVVVGADNRMRSTRVLAYPKPARFNKPT